MGKKHLLILFLFILMLYNVNAKSLNVNPSVIDKTYYIGSSQLSPLSISFENRDNSTFSLSLSKSGTSANFISLSTTSLSFSGQETKNLDVSFNIPQNTQVGLYSGEITYDAGQNDKIPVYINVLKNATTGCRFIIPFTDYEYVIKIGTLASAQDYLVKVSSECSSGILLTELKTTGVILTDSGYEPIRLKGGLPVNQNFNSGATFTFSLETDVSELSTGVYTSFVQIAGISGDDIITSILRFKTTVTGTAKPVGDILSPPSFDKLPDDLNFNQTYELIARNVDPNLDIFVEPNEYIYGLNVLTEDNIWKYIFRPSKSGNTIIKAYSRYKGGIIGNLFSQELRVLVGGPVIAGTNLTLEVYPNVSLWNPGTIVSLLIKDLKTGNIITNPSIYINGVPLIGTQFTIGSVKDYKISITSSGYNTIEQTYSSNPKPVKITIFPGTIVDIGTFINITTDPGDAVIKINEIDSAKEFNGDTIGIYNIRAIKEGYVEGNETFIIKDFPAGILTQPDTSNAKKGKNITFELTKEDTFIVYYKKEFDKPREQILTRTSKIVSFPVRFNSGIYSVEVENNPIPIWEYELKKSSLLGNFSIPLWMYIAVGILVLIFIMVLIFKNSGGRSSEGGETSKMEFDISP